MPGTTSGADYPNYIAFRTTDGNGGRLLTVVAALEPYDGSRFPWGTWYHERDPAGEFKKVPGNYLRLGMSDAVATTIIELIRHGHSLPGEFVARLPVVK